MVTSFSASRRSSDARTQTEVVPSPTSSSWTLEILTRIFAAGLSRLMDFRMVAPSLVTVIVWFDADSGARQRMQKRMTSGAYAKSCSCPVVVDEGEPHHPRLKQTHFRPER